MNVNATICSKLISFGLKIILAKKFFNICVFSQTLYIYARLLACSELTKPNCGSRSNHNNTAGDCFAVRPTLESAHTDKSETVTIPSIGTLQYSRRSGYDEMLFVKSCNFKGIGPGFWDLPIALQFAICVRVCVFVCVYVCVFASLRACVGGRKLNLGRYLLNRSGLYINCNSDTWMSNYGSNYGIYLLFRQNPSNE